MPKRKEKTGRPASAPGGRPARPRRPVKVVKVVKVPFERFPGASRNPALARALRIHFGMQAGLERTEAVRLADEALAPAPKVAPKDSRRRALR
jgi:hypothetical protein